MTEATPWAVVVALVSSLGSLIGILGVLVRGVVASRRETKKQSNGEAHVTKHDFTEAMKDLKAAGVEGRTVVLRELTDVKDEVKRTRDNVHRLAGQLSAVLVEQGKQEVRLGHLEDQQKERP